MLPRSSSLVRAAVLTMAALVLGLGVGRSVRAQYPAQTGGAGGYGQAMPSGAPAAGSTGGQTSAATSASSSGPVLTPGYFEVVCPAICYGGAFRVCNVRAFAGAGYYGPFRRYWGYSTYGPNLNIGPDGSMQFGLQSGVMYEATRLCKGLRKHGTDPGAYAGVVPQVGGTGGSPVGGGGTGGSPVGNTAHLRLLVPENAKVLVEGSKTATTGTVREFVSPPLEPGKNMIYSVLVRYTDAGGKTIEETHSIRVRANDRFDLDCTKPATAAEPGATAERP